MKNEFIQEKKLSGSVVVRTKSPLTYSKIPATACVIPVGTELEVYFSEANHQRVYFEYQGSLRVVTLRGAHKFFTKFKKSPSMRTIEKYSFDGVATTPLGNRTEPDGHDQFGAPSWLLVWGLI